MSFPEKVTLVEVGPRDGLQHEKSFVPTAVKIELIQQLAEAGLPVIEAASFVSPKWIPALADGAAVLEGIQKSPSVRYPVLIPNLTGLEAAISAGANEIAIFTTPSETFSQKNTHCSVHESMMRMRDVVTHAKREKLRIRAYISCVLGCPYEGEMPVHAVSAMADDLWKLGVDEISLGDTIGVGTPLKTTRLIEAIKKVVPCEKLAVHFHDTYGQALVNIYAAMQCGIAIVDASVAGLGGCPYAKGASGNVATEDVVYMLNGMGIQTGVNLQKLVAAGRFICQQLGHAPQSRVNLIYRDESNSDSHNQNK